MMRILLALSLLSLLNAEIYAQEYLALGDSYTIGEKVAEIDRWPNILTRGLKGTPLEVDSAQIIAKTGWTTAELLEGIKADQPQGPFELVSLLIGVNNQYRGQSLERFETELIELIELAIGYSKKGTSGVFLVSIPDWGVTPFAKGRNRDEIAREIDAFNAVVSTQAKAYQLPFIDITAISKRAANDLSLLAPDQLHPSAKMYSLWVEQIKLELLKNK